MPISTFWKRWTGEPSGAAPASAPEQPAAVDRQHRATRRERLLSLVREYMGEQGIGALTYKFKVLTLDNSGDSFIVMIDIQAGTLEPLERAMRQHEKALQAMALSRHDIQVKNVYWRLQDGAAPVTASTKPAEPPASAPPAKSFDLPDTPPVPNWAQQDFEPTRPLSRDK